MHKIILIGVVALISQSVHAAISLTVKDNSVSPATIIAPPSGH